VGLFAKLGVRELVGVLAGLSAVLALGSRPLGYFFQRTMTVGVDFKRAKVQRIVRRIEENNRVCYHVHVDVETD
jgi:hypothetical protein